MPIASTKHKGRDKSFSWRSFDGGMNREKQASALAMNQLSRARNVKYVLGKDEEGNSRISLMTRQGTVKITNTAISSSVLSAAYFEYQSQYVIATSSTLYYLDANYDPQEIGSIDGLPTFTEFNHKLIIHDSGITKAWDGTTFETLNDYYVDEIIETGDGSETEFSGTVDNPAVDPSSLTITFTDTSTKTMSDNGTGRLTGNVASAWVKTITGMADNGSGLIRVTSAGHGFSTSDEINISSVVGTTEANNTASNPTWTITQIDANTFDLQDSTFTNAYTSGGTASKHTIIYSTGAYVFKCDGSPDNTTTVTATYEKTNGAPKSKAGFVRGGELYLWGDSDNPDYLWYSGTNDEDAWNSTSSGGYLRVGERDGQELIGAVNFYTSVLCIKEKSLHRIDGFPGDSDFAAEPIKDTIGGVAYRTVSFDSEVVTYLSSEGFVGMAASDRYGDVQRAADLSVDFNRHATTYANSAAYSAYNPVDKQIWVALSTDGSTTYLDKIYSISMGTGGQLSEYKFAFGHSWFGYSGGEMLIGGSDGHLYRLDKTQTIFKDNGVSYSADTFIRSGFQDFGYVMNKKHNKKIFIRISSGLGYTGTLNLYRNDNFTAFHTQSISSSASSRFIFDGQNIEIYDLSGIPIYYSGSEDSIIRKRFNYKNLMWEITNLYGTQGAEPIVVTFKSAIIGE